MALQISRDEWPTIEGDELEKDLDIGSEVTLIGKNGVRHGILTSFNQFGRIYVQFNDRTRPEYILDNSSLRLGWL